VYDQLLKLAARIPGRLARFRYGRRPEGIEYVRYGWTPIEVALSQSAASDSVRAKIISGHYERPEADSIQNLLDKDEIVVELGGGVGLISTIAMKSGKAREVHTFEADERLVPLLAATHKRNGVENVKVHNFAVTGDPEAVSRGYLDLVLRKDFWGNSILSMKRGVRTTRVNTKSLNAIVEELDPTVLIVDIEGAEDQLFAGVDLGRVKRVSIELHPWHLGKDGVRRVFADLHDAGLTYDTRYSVGGVPVFSRHIARAGAARAKRSR
jgi:FkbM family methyltransferase